MTTTDAPQADLQYLKFVERGAYVAGGLAQWSYSTVKSFVPVGLVPRLESAETTVLSYAKPYIEIGKDVAPKILKVADQQVGEALSYVRNSDNVKTFTQARENYLKKVEEAVSQVKSQAKVDERLAALIETLNQAVAQARTASWNTFGQATERLNEAWKAFVSHPQVQSVVARSQPSLDSLKKTYLDAHGRVTGDPRYGALHGRVSQGIAAVQGTSAYKSAASYVEPVVKPIVERKEVQDIVDHFKPKGNGAEAAAQQPRVQPQVSAH